MPLFYLMRDLHKHQFIIVPIQRKDTRVVMQIHLNSTIMKSHFHNPRGDKVRSENRMILRAWLSFDEF